MLQNPESLSILELFSISWCFFWHAELYLIFSLIQSAKLLMPTVARADPTPAAPRKAFPLNKKGVLKEIDLSQFSLKNCYI